MSFGYSSPASYCVLSTVSTLMFVFVLSFVLYRCERAQLSGEGHGEEILEALTHTKAPATHEELPVCKNHDDPQHQHQLIQQAPV